MSSEDLIYSKHEALATIVFNRPHAHNALTPQMLCRLADAFMYAQHDQQIRAIVVTGAGDRAFCSGGDLGQTLPLLSGARKPQDAWDQRLLDDPDVHSLASLCDARLNKPIIAAVNGVCMAAGAELLLGTDIRVSASHAVYAWPEVRHGLIPFAGSLSRLPSQLPYCHAMELLFTGEAINAQKAHELGLVNYVVEPDQVMPLAKQLALKIAGNGPVAVCEIKKAAVASLGLTAAEAFEIERESYQRIMSTQDAQEGPRAFMEKRAPRFQGK